jgi:hypothetical protein
MKSEKQIHQFLEQEIVRLHKAAGQERKRQMKNQPKCGQHPNRPALYK